jgi:alpha-N-acetylglucosaminidase
VNATVQEVKAVYGDLVSIGASEPGPSASVFDGPVAGGIDHIWQFDTYNELLPASNSSAFLSALSNATYAPLAQADPGAIWMLQGWMFSFSESFWVPRAVQAYIDGVPDGRLLVLDLDAYLEPIWRTTDRFYGAAFVWGVINDGGQRPGLFGNFSRIVTGPAEAAASNMLGISSAPEGIFVNPVLFELLADVIWGDIPTIPDSLAPWSAGGAAAGSIDLDAWLVRCITARYGLDLPPAATPSLRAALPRASDAGAPLPLVSREASLLLVSAWRQLAVAVYNHTAEQSGSLVEGIPSIGDGPGYQWCDTKALAGAWRDMSQALGAALAPGAPVSPLLVFDGADVVRQVTVNSVGEFSGMLAGATNRSDAAAVASISSAILTLLDSFNTTLSSHPDFSTTTWAQSARDLCAGYGGEELARHCVENALWQITLWGAVEARDAGANLDTYAAKQWSGAASALYKQRWGIVLAEAKAAAAAQRPPDNTAVVEAQVNATVRWATDATQSFSPVQVTPSLLVAGNEALFATVGGDADAGLESFDVYMDSDADGEIMPTMLATKDSGQMAAFCLADPSCGGFNANGWLKAIGAKRVPFPGSTLWVRKQTATPEPGSA